MLWVSLAIFRSLIRLLKIVLVLNMEAVNGMKLWICILSGYFNIKSVPTSADGVIACEF